jgi:hypothetical protein
MQEISAFRWFYYKNISRCTVLWMSKAHYCLLKFDAVQSGTNVPHASIFKAEYLGSKYLRNICTFLPNYAASSYNNSLHIRRHENLWSTLYDDPNNVRHTVPINKFLIMQFPLSSNSFTSLSFKQRIIISQLCYYTPLTVVFMCTVHCNIQCCSTTHCLFSPHIC